MKIKKEGNYIVINDQNEQEVYNAPSVSTSFAIKGKSITIYDRENDSRFGNDHVTALISSFTDFDGLEIVGGLPLWLREKTASVASLAITEGAPEDSKLYNIKVSLTADQINNIGTNPIEAIPAQGVGTSINIIGGTAFLNWGTTAFTANELEVKNNGATIPQGLFISGLLSSTANTSCKIAMQDSLNTLAADSAIEITGTDSVLTGDSTVDIYITYEVVTL